MDRWLVFAIDVLICTLVLRVVIGWLLAYPRLIRLLLMLVAVVVVGVLVNAAGLPLAGMLFLLMLVPIVVILFLSFLPELSRVYQAASRGNLFRPRIFQGDEILPDLTEALRQLQTRRMGCILVFPGTQDVDGLVSGGEEVDAKVNRSLLLSIFDPHCPRHDGAAVIRNNRLVRIGAVLPLASAEGKDAHLGTRHLAALGLSERSDSDVLVVSEERGVLSHARDGHLNEVPFSTSEELQAKLFEILGDHNGEVEHSRRRALLPITLWAVALLLAALGSWQVEVIRRQFKERYSETVYFQPVDATIQYTLDPNRQFVDGWDTTSARLILRVPEAIQQSRKQPTITIDLREQTFGRQLITLDSTMVSGLPEGAVVQSFSPPTLSFSLHEVIQADHPLSQPTFSGLNGGLVVASATLSHQTIAVKIRETSWRSNRRLEARPVDLSTITSPGEYTFPVEFILPATIERRTTDPISVRVVIESKPVDTKPAPAKK